MMILVNHEADECGWWLKQVFEDLDADDASASGVSASPFWHDADSHVVGDRRDPQARVRGPCLPIQTMSFGSRRDLVGSKPRGSGMARDFPH
jgi:hypothetical protein